MSEFRPPIGTRKLEPELPPAYRSAARSASVVLVLNALLSAAKLGFGLAGNSYALVADGLNNLADTGVSVALWVGLRLAGRPPDQQHAYGHGRLEQETSRLVALGVLIAGGGIIFGAVTRVGDPHELPALSVLVVAAQSIAVKAWMYWYQKRAAKRLSSSALEADALNHKYDVAATVCVLLGTAAVHLGGDAWAPADDVAAVAIGLMMIVAAGGSILQTSSELLDQMPPDEILEGIREAATAFPEVSGVEKVMGRKSGLHYFIDMHLEVPHAMTVQEAHALSHSVKECILLAIPEIRDVVVHLEPDTPGKGSGVDIT